MLFNLEFVSELKKYFENGWFSLELWWLHTFEETFLHLCSSFLTAATVQSTA